MTSARQEFNRILLQKRNMVQNTVVTRNVPKTSVEQTNSNEELYLYLYPLGT